MRILDQADHLKAGLSDGTMLPLSTENDKLYSILNVLKGHEEFTIDVTGIIISSNLEAVNITGYEEWEVIGKHFSMFYPTDDIGKGQPIIDLDAALHDGKLINTSWKVKKKQIPFWAKIKIVPILDSLNSLRGYKIVLRDTAHKVFTQFNLQKVKNEYLNFYHNSTFGILRFRKQNGQLRMANKKALQILGISHFHDFSFHEAFQNEDDCRKFKEMIDRDERVNYFEFQLKNSHGSKRWLSIDCKWYGSSGFIEGIIIDVTEKKLKEVALQKLHHDLDTFIYHASHDLRSPLTSAMGLLNLMEMENAGALTAYVQMMRDRINHLDTLLRDLSTIAFNNNSEINHERVFIKEEIEFLLRDFMMDERRIEFMVQADDHVPFFSDVLRFRTIVRNLVSNAVKFHNQMEKTPFVKITTTYADDAATIIVEDNGIGIEKAEMEKIYNMFHRGHTSKSGSGLGLYTVRSMLDQLGGTVEIKSVVGCGTTVTIVLPNR